MFYLGNFGKFYLGNFVFILFSSLLDDEVKVDWTLVDQICLQPPGGLLN